MFIEALSLYFYSVLIFTNYAAFTLISIGFLIYTLPKNIKEINKKLVISMIIKFVGM